MVIENLLVVFTFFNVLYLVTEAETEDNTGQVKIPIRGMFDSLYLFVCACISSYI